jgi:hypothetical protein
MHLFHVVQFPSLSREKLICANHPQEAVAAVVYRHAIKSRPLPVARCAQISPALFVIGKLHLVICSRLRNPCEPRAATIAHHRGGHRTIANIAGKLSGRLCIFANTGKSLTRRRGLSIASYTALLKGRIGGPAWLLRLLACAHPAGGLGPNRGAPLRPRRPRAGAAGRIIPVHHPRTDRSHLSVGIGRTALLSALQHNVA